MKGGEGGVKSYYQQKIDALEVILQDKTQDLRRQEAQRNELNTQGGFVYENGALEEHLFHEIIACVLVRLLRDEIQKLQEPGSHVGEVVKSMGKQQVLVKVGEFFLKEPPFPFTCSSLHLFAAELPFLCTRFTRRGNL